jgi:Tfp pilus assembly protein PilN
MTQIDFLPPRYRERSVQERAKLWHLAVVCLFGGVIAVAALYQFSVRQRVLAELSEVEANSNAAQAKIQRVGQLQSLAKSESADAELMTWLRHPWPRTRLLGAIAAHLPPEVTLEDLRLEQEEMRSALPQPTASPEAAGAPAPKLSPPALDLIKLRSLYDTRQSLIILEGEATDTAALHTFLAKIGAVGLYSKVELISIESSASTEKQTAAQFKARLTIRRGFGQSGGPQAAWRNPRPAGESVASKSPSAVPSALPAERLP